MKLFYFIKYKYFCIILEVSYVISLHNKPIYVKTVYPEENITISLHIKKYLNKDITSMLFLETSLLVEKITWKCIIIRRSLILLPIFTIPIVVIYRRQRNDSLKTLGFEFQLKISNWICHVTILPIKLYFYNGIRCPNKPRSLFSLKLPHCHIDVLKFEFFLKCFLITLNFIYLFT